MSTVPIANAYPARFDVQYTEVRSRVSVLFRLILIIPIVIVVALLSGANLAIAVALMLLFRRRYPEPWFRWALYLNQLTNRVGAYALLLVDEYPSTTDQQQVTVEADLDETQLSRWMPLVKWFLAIPHYIALVFLFLVVALVVLLAWFIIIITGRFPRGLFGFVVGVMRWTWRVTAYVSLLTTDRYPPFSLQ
ncbi:MAG: DUF4389 domain-containing protein [Dehalococcoidia bacterium]